MLSEEDKTTKCSSDWQCRKTKNAFASKTKRNQTFWWLSICIFISIFISLCCIHKFVGVPLVAVLQNQNTIFCYDEMKMCSRNMIFMTDSREISNEKRESNVYDSIERKSRVGNGKTKSSVFFYANIFIYSSIYLIFKPVTRHSLTLPPMVGHASPKSRRLQISNQKPAMCIITYAKLGNVHRTSVGWMTGYVRERKREKEREIQTKRKNI